MFNVFFLLKLPDFIAVHYMHFWPQIKYEILNQCKKKQVRRPHAKS